MKSHFSLSGRVAVACAVSGAATLVTGVCLGQIAADYATDPAYASGWAAGQNGGYGFTAWSFAGGSGSPIQQAINSTSPFNQLGTAWTLFNPLGAPAGTDLAEAGRGFAPLQVGQTITTIIDNPTERAFYRGYTVRLNSGGANKQLGGVERFAAYRFEYFNNGLWQSTKGNTSLFDTDTASGARLTFTLTGPDTYHFSMTPLNNPALAYNEDGTLSGTGPINWIQFELYNTQSDPTKATDFYISSITIVPEPASLALIGLGSLGLLFLRRRE